MSDLKSKLTVKNESSVEIGTAPAHKEHTGPQSKIAVVPQGNSSKHRPRGEK